MARSPDHIPIRKLKKKVLALLGEAEFEVAMEAICDMPPRQVVNPLFSFLYSLDETVKWRAVSAMGAVIAKLARSEIESARIIMRRFIWNLNDESGGIGWGSPEAMGETLARSKRLADEYTDILLSYIRPDGNFLEHENLQRGVLWAVGRLARVRPQRVTHCTAFVLSYLQTRDLILNGHTLWALSAFPPVDESTAIQRFVDDKRHIRIYYEGRFKDYTLAQLAKPLSCINNMEKIR
jgi:hypothetical protein